MGFIKYQHIERIGTDEVKDIEFGKCFIFHKIDGTNAQLWYEDGQIKGGSRNRLLSLDNDNQGFYEYALSEKKYADFFAKYPNLRLYGEFLIPHSLRTYRDDAWRKMYVFDVCFSSDEDKLEYLTYDAYKPLLDEFNIDYVPPICSIYNPTYESLLKLLDKTTFLIEDGKGRGEGLVLKNYDFYNQHGRQTWAKIVTNEFKTIHTKSMGVNEFKDKQMVESMIVDEFCTEAFIEKEYAKIVNENNGWSSKMIPQLLGKIYHELIVEESWNIVKRFKNPTINYKTLNTLVIMKIKQVKVGLFQ